ncbi:MAG: ribonuclease HII [bacterium]|nr:ribonuclease HII [bacterium]
MIIIVNKKYLIGIDEVGRGPLAGPMMVGAIAIAGEPPAAQFLEGIKDSKKLTKLQREKWSKKIWAEKEKAGNINIAIVSISPAVIDKFGISPSLKLAVAKCLKILVGQDDEYQIMLDGSLYAPEKYKNQQTIIKGDEKIPIISAASVVAKVYRDNLMQKLHKKYPEYGFDAHKGYGTAAHIAAIKKHGLSTLHRRSFCRNINLS